MTIQHLPRCVVMSWSHSRGSSPAANASTVLRLHAHGSWAVILRLFASINMLIALPKSLSLRLRRVWPDAVHLTVNPVRGRLGAALSMKVGAVVDASSCQAAVDRAAGAQ